MKMWLTIAVLLSFLLAASTAGEFNPIQLNTGLNSNRFQAGPGFGKHFVCNCESWRLGVEVNNIRNWSAVPAECATHIRDYILKPDPSESQYDSDLNVLTRQVLDFLQELPPINRNNTFLFGLMGTLISDVEFYQKYNDFGRTPINLDKYYQWLTDPSISIKAVLYIKQVYYAAKLKGFRIIILSGSYLKYNDILEERLHNAGIYGWDQLVLNNNENMSDRKFKEAFRAGLLLKNGSTVVGNVGDQWSDLQGINAGKAFKVPNPMYYIP